MYKTAVSDIINSSKSTDCVIHGACPRGLALRNPYLSAAEAGPKGISSDRGTHIMDAAVICKRADGIEKNNFICIIYISVTGPHRGKAVGVSADIKEFAHEFFKIRTAL